MTAPVPAASAASISRRDRMQRKRGNPLVSALTYNQNTVPQERKEEAARNQSEQFSGAPPGALLPTPPPLPGYFFTHRNSNEAEQAIPFGVLTAKTAASSSLRNYDALPPISVDRVALKVTPTAHSLAY